MSELYKVDNEWDGGYLVDKYRPATAIEIAEALLVHCNEVYRGDTFAHEYATRIAKAMIRDFKERAEQTLGGGDE